MEAAEWPNEIDTVRVEDSLKRANERLSNREGHDTLRAELALKRALARKKVSSYI